MSTESRLERRIRVTESLTLAGDFPAATREQWLAEVGRVLLRGVTDASDEDLQRAFAKRLVSRTDDGIEIQPLYTAADAPAPAPSPGQAPFVRSTHAAPVPWEIRQRVWPDVEGSSAVTELESGATGVLVTMAQPVSDPGVLLDRALDGVLLELAPVSLALSRVSDQVECGRALLDRWDAASCPTDARHGTLGVDPLAAWARAGGSFDLAVALDAVASLVLDARERAPRARVLVIDGALWHEAGATEAQELGWSIASAAWLVRELVSREVPLDVAVAAIEFRLAATDDQFLTIAKMRAARRLWARVLEVAGLPEHQRAMVLHAETSRAMLTRYDTWVNTLRSTVACFAAGVGGADAVTVLPHDELLQVGGSALGRRVARNTQTILQLESHLTRVVDMAGGSWFVESLTEQLAERAWAIVQEVDAAGGITMPLESGAIGSAADRAREAREAQVATRRRPLTGLSEFPDITEPAPAPRVIPTGQPEPGARFTPFVLHRLADGFEQQRARADALSRSGEQPVVFLATLGSVAQSTARSTYAKNLFEAAGIRTVAGPVEEFAGSGATVACLCSSDPVYAETGADAAALLRAAGAERIYLAGRGVDVPGVDEEVGVGSDVLDVLTRALDSMGASR
jgi:methylmalonyl-CoA mutase